MIFRAYSNFAASLLSGVIFPVSIFLRSDTFSLIFLPSSSCESPSFPLACLIFRSKFSMSSREVSIVVSGGFLLWIFKG